MREQDFKKWLETRGARTEAGRNTRTYAVRTIEKNLLTLGLPYQDLDRAWQDDKFQALYQRLARMRDDAKISGQDYRILMPQSENPHNRLSSWGSWLRQYATFLSGDPASLDKDADKIRHYVLEHFIYPARETEADTVDLLVRDVNDALSLNQGWPNICQALSGPKFQELAQIPQPDREGANLSLATVFVFSLNEAGRMDSNGKKLILFDANNVEFQPVRNFNQKTGSSAFRIKPKGAGNKADESIETESIIDVARAMLIDGLASRVKALSGGPVNYLTYGGPKLVRYELDPEIARELGIAAHGEAVSMRQDNGTPVSVMPSQISPPPTNLILYGPPGTGKTYATAAEALHLCGIDVPIDRAESMNIYHQLQSAGRIEFVTFHQSVSYEEFIEGRQPVTGADGESSSAGFRLETVEGIFRRISKRAESSHGLARGSHKVTLQGRQVFKMSIGEAANPDDDVIFEEAITEGYALLGFYDIDWSAPGFSTPEAFLNAIKERHPDADISTKSGAVNFPFRFKNWAKKGDIVIVSKGNSKFRAIGEITGDYEYSPSPEQRYEHRRAVKWLWIDRDGVPVEEIYSRRFMMHPIYLLYDHQINMPALERYMNSQNPAATGAPEPFVLIIDEINRANISKVFGELITLLETDKRLGQPNALTVRLPYSGDTFGVPSNLHILGTMNTADRSIALLDTALRRRFTFREMMPEPSVLTDAAKLCGLNLPTILTTLNERIEYLYDREHQIGHAYFTACRSKDDVDEVMRHKVIPLLAEYFFEDWSRIAAVLGDLQSHEGPINGGFLKRSLLKAPPGLDDGDGMPRFRWTLRSLAEGFDYTKLIAS